MRLLLHFLKTGVLLSSLLLSSCNEDQAATEAALIGRWDIQEAYRSGESTTTMMGMFFQFTKDGKLLTNIAGEEEEYVYEVDDQHILQSEGTIEADYAIEKLDNNQLILTTTLGNKPFRMILGKAKTE